MANAFHGVPEKTRLARAVAKALDPCGRFAIVNRAAVEPAGFRSQQIVELPPYYYGAIFEKSLKSWSRLSFAS
jgi:hypothetical protein